MYEFENKVIWGYVYETRFIASWLKVGGRLDTSEGLDKFTKWLKSIDLTEKEVDHIRFLVIEGKLELQDNAKRFLETYK